nr:hypothetical protein [Tanacetum cinerariifolium]
DGGGCCGVGVLVVWWRSGNDVGSVVEHGGSEMVAWWQQRCGSHDGGGGDGAAVVGRPQRWWVAARGGEWHRGSYRSGDKNHFWFRLERSPEKFSGGGRLVAGGGWKVEWVCVFLYV